MGVIKDIWKSCLKENEVIGPIIMMIVLVSSILIAIMIGIFGKIFGLYPLFTINQYLWTSGILMISALFYPVSLTIILLPFCTIYEIFNYVRKDLLKL